MVATDVPASWKISWLLVKARIEAILQDMFQGRKMRFERCYNVRRVVTDLYDLS